MIHRALALFLEQNKDLDCVSEGISINHVTNQVLISGYPRLPQGNVKLTLIERLTIDGNLRSHMMRVEGCMRVETYCMTVFISIFVFMFILVFVFMFVYIYRKVISLSKKSS